MDAFLTFFGFALLAIGGLVSLVGGLWFTLRAFEASTLLGIGTLVLPFVADPIFIFTKWNEARHPFWVGLAGWGICLLGFGLVVVVAPDTFSSDPDPSQVIVADAEEENFEDFEFGKRESQPQDRDGFRLRNKKRERPPSRTDRIRAIKKLPSSVQFDRASLLLHEKVKVVKKSGNSFEGLLQQVDSTGVVVRQYFGSGRMDVPIRAADIDRIDWNP